MANADPRERTVLDALKAHAGMLGRHVDLADLARRWAPDVGTMPPHAVMRLVFERLRMPLYRDLLGDSESPEALLAPEVVLSHARYQPPRPAGPGLSPQELEARLRASGRYVRM